MYVCMYIYNMIFFFLFRVVHKWNRESESTPEPGKPPSN